MQPNNDTPLVDEELVVGPGTLTAAPEAQPSTLDGVTESEYVDLFNPLSYTFRAKVASSRPVNVPVTVHQTDGLQSGIKTESDLAMGYGLSGFKNQSHPSLAHIAHTVDIGSGKTRRFPGNEAQVILRQLVGHLLQVEGKGLKLADPYEREQAEKRIVRGRGLVSDIYDSQVVTASEQISQTIERSNEELSHGSEPETAFPDVQPAGNQDDGRDVGATGTGPAGGVVGSPGGTSPADPGTSPAGDDHSPKA